MSMNRRFASIVRTGATACIIGGLAAGCSSSNGGFNDPVEDLLGDPLVMMGLKVDPNQETIDYGPRSPLVMPAPAQEQALPPPQATPESFGVAWPNDPDEVAKREEAELRKASMNEKPRDTEYLSKAMTPAELDEWGRRFGNTGGAGAGEIVQPRREENKVVGPRELLDRRKASSNELRSEPTRATLAEPPPGYRTPAPPVEGYGNPEEKKKGFFARLFNRS
jgi:hypothetical protein